jgi:hypothetical protein
LQAVLYGVLAIIAEKYFMAFTVRLAAYFTFTLVGWLWVILGTFAPLVLWLWVLLDVHMSPIFGE